MPGIEVTLLRNAPVNLFELDQGKNLVQRINDDLGGRSKLRVHQSP